MKAKVGDYLIETDDKQFIVKRIDTIKAGKFTKEENVGKEKETVIGYATGIDFALKLASRQTILDNNDLDVIIRKQMEIHKDIKDIKQMLEDEKYLNELFPIKE